MLSRRAMLGASLLLVAGCADRRVRAAGPARPEPTEASRPTSVAARPATKDPKVIAARATVPVLCWHQLRDWRSSDGEYDRTLLICPPANFRAQLDALQRAGYTTISPDQYLAHLTTGAALPPRPVLLTFDDAQGSQITVALPELIRRRMTATFFVMTVVLDKPGWMRRSDVRRLDAAGMTVAAHTYDHHRADRYAGDDWRVQLQQPRAELERLLGKPVRHFAYPYGAWSRSDFPQLARAGYVTAFQLGDEPMDPQRPLYTLRRNLMDSRWTGRELLAYLSRTG
jgi:peptidoglycan/xylan/chitin deacetylase (PgdA/CDA1 family)